MEAGRDGSAAGGAASLAEKWGWGLCPPNNNTAPRSFPSPSPDEASRVPVHLCLRVASHGGKLGGGRAGIKGVYHRPLCPPHVVWLRGYCELQLPQTGQLGGDRTRGSRGHSAGGEAGGAVLGRRPGGAMLGAWRGGRGGAMLVGDKLGVLCWEQGGGATRCCAGGGKCRGAAEGASPPQGAPQALTPHFLPPAPVLHGDVHRVRVLRAALAAAPGLLLARHPAHPVLDRQRGAAGHAGEGRLLRRVPEPAEPGRLR